MDIIFSYTVEIGEEWMSRFFKFTLHAEIDGFRTIHYESSHASRIEACRQALELFAMRATPEEAMVRYDDRVHEQYSRITGGPPNFIVDHLPDNEIKATILQIIEIWKKGRNNDLLTESRRTSNTKLLR